MSLLKRYSAQHPQLRYQLSVLSSEAILERLASNALDLGLSYLDRLDRSQFDFIELAQTRIGLLFDRRHFDFAQAPDWATLAQLPLGLLSSGMHFRQSIDHALRSRGLTPRLRLESDSVHSLLQAVGAGLCCALMPLDSGPDQLQPQLCLLPIEDARTLAPLGLIMRRNAPRSALAEACFALAAPLARAPDEPR